MKKSLFLILSLFLLLPITLKAAETTVIVRVQAKDAKFVGTSMGGARVVIRNSLTGEILAEGVTSGETGDTELIMETPYQRGMKISNEATSKFRAVIDIDKPVFATIAAYGPLNEKQAIASASTQLWLLPGKDILGDGIVITLMGFVVDILSPATREVTGQENNRDLTIQAKVVMMCGCPIKNGGMWDAEKYEVQATIIRNGKVIKETPLKVLEKTSIFEGQATVPGNGTYEIMVSAYDAQTGNTGIDQTRIVVN